MSYIRSPYKEVGASAWNIWSDPGEVTRRRREQKRIEKANYRAKKAQKGAK